MSMLLASKGAVICGSVRAYLDVRPNPAFDYGHVDGMGNW